MRMPDHPTQPPSVPRSSRLAMASLLLPLAAVFCILLVNVPGINGLPWSFILPGVGLVSLLASPVVGVVSIVLIARSRCFLTGYGYGIGGLIITGFIVAGCMAPMSRIPKGSMAYERARNADILSNALKRYEHDHGQLPPRLSSLVPKYLSQSNAGTLFGPTRYPQFVQSEFHKTVKTVEDAQAADENGPYVYLGHTNHSSGIILFEKPTAWKPYPVQSSFHGRVFVLHHDYSAPMVSEEQVRLW